MKRLYNGYKKYFIRGLCGIDDLTYKMNMCFVYINKNRI